MAQLASASALAPTAAELQAWLPAAGEVAFMVLGTALGVLAVGVIQE